MMNRMCMFRLAALILCGFLHGGDLWAESIDPDVDGSQYAYGANIGWINLDPQVSGDSTDYGVTIDSEGNFDGWAWGENIGWIHFQSVSPVVYKVKACVVNLDDLANFAANWLAGDNPPANLDGAGTVDMLDFNIFASYWVNFCPDYWTLN